MRKLGKQEQPGGEPILQIKNVTAAYGNAVRVLNDVTVTVPRGRTVAVVGESGSGKSTLARVITGLLPPMQGEIVFNGKPLPRALKDRERRHAAAHPDDLSDAGYGAESAPDGL